MTAEEKRASLLEETEDVAREDQIFLRENLDNKNKSGNFAISKNKNYDERTRTIPTGSQPQGFGIQQTVAESNAGRSEGTADSGLREGWDKSRFLTNLKANAQKNGVWIDDISGIAFANDQLISGFENEPYISLDGQHVIKLNNLNLLNDNDTQYERTRDFDYFIDRLNAHNELFTGDAYEVIGFAENSKGEISVVLQQPFVYNAELATQEEIDTELTRRGFEQNETADGMKYWTDGVYEVSDAKPANVLKDAEGNLHFIDTDIVLVNETGLGKPKFEDFGGDVVAFVKAVDRWNKQNELNSAIEEFNNAEEKKTKRAAGNRLLKALNKITGYPSKGYVAEGFDEYKSLIEYFIGEKPTEEDIKHIQKSTASHIEKSDISVYRLDKIETADEFIECWWHENIHSVIANNEDITEEVLSEVHNSLSETMQNKLSNLYIEDTATKGNEFLAYASQRLASRGIGIIEENNPEQKAEIQKIIKNDNNFVFETLKTIHNTLQNGTNFSKHNNGWEADASHLQNDGTGIGQTAKSDGSGTEAGNRGAKNRVNSGSSGLNFRIPIKHARTEIKEGAEIQYDEQGNVILIKPVDTKYNGSILDYARETQSSKNSTIETSNQTKKEVEKLSQPAEPKPEREEGENIMSYVIRLSEWYNRNGKQKNYAKKKKSRQSALTNCCKQTTGITTIMLNE
jgi:hypothetical protein